VPDVRDAGPAPLDYFFHAAGPAARPTLVLGWIFTGISIVVCVLVAALLLWSVRRRPADDRVVSGNPAAIRWVAIASAISVVVLIGMAVYATAALIDVAFPRTPPALVIVVTGYDWWWRADYGDFETANEIHIPVGRPVLIKLRSADVIHAFWVPQLAGKTQMITGLSNHQWLQADRPGVYRGQCTQFCGLQHAHMAFEVVADTPADYERWRLAQSAPAAHGAQTSAGEAVFVGQCGGCHTVRGSDARGTHGPDLTHLMSRRQIAAGMFDTDPRTLADWIAHAQDLKPGSRMPDIALGDRDRAALLAYLTELK